MNHVEFGLLGESVASCYLERRGYEILERNYKINGIEIDILAYAKTTLVIVEVKTRHSAKYGRPCEAVDKNKQYRIRKAGKYIWQKIEFMRLKYPRLNIVNIRIDVIEVELIQGLFKVTHLINCF